MLPNLSALAVDTSPTSASPKRVARETAPPNLEGLPPELFQKIIQDTLFRPNPRLVCAEVARLLGTSKSVSAELTEQLFERLCDHFHWLMVLVAHENYTALTGGPQVTETRKQWFLRVCGARRKVHDEVVRRLTTDDKKFLMRGATFSPTTGWPLLDEFFIVSDRPLSGLYNTLASQVTSGSLDWIALILAQATYRIGENTAATAELVRDLKDRNKLWRMLAPAAVKTNGMSLQFMGEYRNNRDVILAAVRQDGLAVEYAPVFEEENDAEFAKEVAMEAVKQNGMAWQELNYKLPVLKADDDAELEPWVRALAFAAVKQNPASFEHMLPDKLAGNRELVLEVVKTKPGLLYHSSDQNLQRELMSNKDFAMRAMLDDHRSVVIAPAAVRDDSCLMVEVILKFPDALEHVSERLRNTFHVVLAAVLGDPHALTYASDALKNNRELVLRAVEQNVKAMWHVSDALRADREFVLQVMKMKDGGDMLGYVSNGTLEDDEEIVRAAVQTSPREGLSAASVRLRSNVEIVKLAIESTDKSANAVGDVLRQMGDELHDSLEMFKFVFELGVPDFGIVLGAWTETPLVWYFNETKRGKDLVYVHSALRNDFDVVLAAVSVDGLALEFASWMLRQNSEIVAAAIAQNPEARQFAIR